MTGAPLIAPADVLAADDVFGDVRAVTHRAQRTQHLHLFAAHAVRAEVGRRLHAHEGQELDQMVLHHVAQRAAGLVVTRAPLDAERFAGGDLDVVDVAVVPDRLEDGIGEAQDHDVLRGFLAQEMVDAEGCRFVEGRADDLVELAGAGEVRAEGLFHDDARPAAFLARLRGGRIS